MSKTTADLFRERGWGVGTKVALNNAETLVVVVVLNTMVVTEDENGEEWPWKTTVDGWSLYTPTPPVPTQKEWKELWPKMVAWRDNWGAKEQHYLFPHKTSQLLLAIEAIEAKGGVS